MNIHLVRHGEAAANWQEADNPGLSKLGRQQATVAAQQLAGRIAADVQLISSPMLRAQQTAQPLADTLGSDVTIVEAFREIPTPVELDQRHAWLKTIARQSWLEQHEMVCQWQQSLLQALRQIDQHAVVFTHFMVLNAIVSSLTGRDRVVCFLPDNASITTLKLDGGKLELVELGRELRTKVN